MSANDAGELRAYHESTSHSLARLQRDPHVLDWANMPRPFKVYPDLAAEPLPAGIGTGGALALEAIADPGSAPPPGPPLDRAALARLLHLSAGVLRHRTWPGGEIWFRAAACTGALYHVDLYLVTAPLPDLEAGVWHYGPHDHALRRLRAGDHRAALVAATAADPAAAAAPVLLVYTSTFWRNAWKYRARAWRHAFWDAGTILANLLALAAAADIPARVVQAFVDDAVNGLLDLEREREAALGVVALGAGALAPPPAPEAPPLGLAVLPSSPHEVRYGAIARAHAASSLGDAAQVRAVRGGVAPPFVVPDGPAVPLAARPPADVPEPIEAVILRRGSTRRFSREPIGFDQLSTVVHAATRGFPTDCPVRATCYVIANAVDGLPPGAWVHDPTREALIQLQAGDLRREAGFLGLQQELAADAAANLYFLVDLEPVFAAMGGRGYRAAELAGAVAGGRAYLAAYAQRLGASGLTFFDDEVTRFFSPHAAGASVMFLVAVGRRSLRTSA